MPVAVQLGLGRNNERATIVYYGQWASTYVHVIYLVSAFLRSSMSHNLIQPWDQIAVWNSRLLSGSQGHHACDELCQHHVLGHDQ